MCIVPSRLSIFHHLPAQLSKFVGARTNLQFEKVCRFLCALPTVILTVSFSPARTQDSSSILWCVNHQAATIDIGTEGNFPTDKGTVRGLFARKRKENEMEEEMDYLHGALHVRRSYSHEGKALAQWAS